MLVYLFECPLDGEIHDFAVIAESESEYVGEQWEPETLAYEVDKKRLN